MKIKSFIFFSVLLFNINPVKAQVKDSLLRVKFYSENSIAVGIEKSDYNYEYNGNFYNGESDLSRAIYSVNGIRLGLHQFGLGAGIDKWNEALLFPLFIEYKLNFTITKFCPFVFLDQGYSFLAYKKIDPYYTKSQSGGYMAAIGVGASYKVSHKLTVMTSIGLKLQVLNYTTSYQGGHAPYDPNYRSKSLLGFNFTVYSIGLKF